MSITLLTSLKAILRRTRARLAAENGFTMIVALGVLTVTSLLVAATFIALQGQTQLGQDNLSAKRAYSAAEAGVNAFLYDMNQNPNYWETCGNDTLAATAVPGSSDGEQYSYQPIYANGNTSCTTNVINSLVDNTTGTIRMVFTGYAGNRPQVQRGIVVSFRMNSPLDFLWYTHFEAFDPATGHTGCNVFYRQGRASSCNINWFSRDVMNGPMYTDDQYLIAAGAAPTFGRNAGDKIESSELNTSNPQEICAADNCGSATMHGTAVPGATPVPTPTDNSELLTDAQNYGKVFTGTTTIYLSGDTAFVTTCLTSTCAPTQSVDITQNPIIYVSNAAGCSIPSYNPTAVTYPTTGSYYWGCAGDVYVYGTYSSPLTIAAADDVIIARNPSGAAQGVMTATSDGAGNPTGGATLGLVANQFIRVQHGCNGSGDIASQTLKNPVVDAALLALDHSFMGDNYSCGIASNLGNLNIHGAIAQYYRGAVSTGSGSPTTGYAKNYNYDDRLASLLPPYLFDISNSGWHISRETLCVPPGQGSNSTTTCQ